MISKHRLAAISFVSLLVLAAQGQELPSPQQLIKAANAASDLTGIRPYTLEVSLVVKSGTQDEKKGRITVFQDKGRSRTELEIGNYRELRIVIGNREYVVRNALARPVELREMENARQLWQADVGSSDQLGHSFAQKIDKIDANCFDVTRPSIVDVRKPEWTSTGETVRYCFDPDMKVLLLASTYREKGKPLSEIRYVEYRRVGGVQFPHAVRHLRLGKPSGVDFEDIQISSLNPESVSFSPPEGAKEIEGCENVRQGRLIKKVEPFYPQMAKMAHIQGDVYVSATIGKDGKLAGIRPISGHPILIQSVLDALKYWEYSPYMCDAGPVEVETILMVRFHM